MVPSRVNCGGWRKIGVTGDELFVEGVGRRGGEVERT